VLVDIRACAYKLSISFVQEVYIVKDPLSPIDFMRNSSLSIRGFVFDLETCYYFYELPSKDSSWPYECAIRWPLTNDFLNDY
jgi:hypothetical protein